MSVQHQGMVKGVSALAILTKLFTKPLFTLRANFNTYAFYHNVLKAGFLVHYHVYILFTSSTVGGLVLIYFVVQCTSLAR